MRCRGSATAGPPPIPGGIPSPIPAPKTTIQGGEWNTIEVVLDANIVRAFLNDNAGIRDGVADPGGEGGVGLPRRAIRLAVLLAGVGALSIARCAVGPRAGGIGTGGGAESERHKDKGEEQADPTRHTNLR